MRFKLLTDEEYERLSPGDRMNYGRQAAAAAANGGERPLTPQEEAQIRAWVEPSALEVARDEAAGRKTRELAPGLRRELEARAAKAQRRTASATGAGLVEGRKLKVGGEFVRRG